MPQRVWSVRRERQSLHPQQGPPRRNTAFDVTGKTDPMGLHRAPTRDQLYEEAKDLNIRGRSMMNKHELRWAVDHKAGR